MQPHALVTGAAGGIGSETARLLGKAGYSVTALDLADCDLTVQTIAADGGEATAAIVDVRDRSQVERAVAEAAARCGRLDVLVTAAGTSGQATRLEDIGDTEASFVLDVNLKGTLWAIQAALPHLRKLGGRIVCIGSIAGQVGGVRTSAHYAASKGAVHSLVRAVASAEAPSGVAVNCVAPGVVDTPMISTNNYDVGAIPVGRFASSADIANVALFLASPEASYLSGAIVDVNGGLHYS